VVLLVSVVAAGGCGGAHATTRAASTVSEARSAAATIPGPVALHLTGTVRLPAAVQLPAVAPYGSGALAIGGLDSADASVSDILSIGDGGARDVGRLPAARHDAAAANIDGQAYFFGGGDLGSASDLILRVGSGGSRVVGRLPINASDIEAATIGHTAYVVGGYTETTPLRTIVAFTPGAGVRVAGMLPRPLRYAAIAAVGGRLLIAGGTSGVIAQRAILSFDPRTGSVRQVGLLPHPITHAAGASLNGRFYVLGGRGENLDEQRSSMLAVDPSSGAVTSAGRLPRPLSDLGAASLSGRILLVGGRDSSGAAQAQALTLAPAR
jgi:hypothetical protein